MKQSKIAFFEPWFFLFFGLFHLHRIWGLVDRNAYADFWMSVMAQKGAFYYYLCGKSDTQCALLQVPFSYMQKYRIQSKLCMRYFYGFIALFVRSSLNHHNKRGQCRQANDGHYCNRGVVAGGRSAGTAS